MHFVHPETVTAIIRVLPASRVVCVLGCRSILGWLESWAGWNIGLAGILCENRSRIIPKETPAYLLALGRSSLPVELELAGGRYSLEQIIKHDFFAATALYSGDCGKIIVKLGRNAPICGIPTDWIGAFLARREASAYQVLSDLPAIPRFLGRLGRTGIAHAYIEGQPLAKGLEVPDAFFDDLRGALESIHARGMAYVDLEKPQNVIAGDDGMPYLIDFQICWQLPRRWGGELWPARWLRKRFQEGDWYHLLKLRRRIRPDQLSKDELKRSYEKPFYVRLHRMVFAPLLIVRRWILRRLDPMAKAGERGRLTP